MHMAHATIYAVGLNRGAAAPWMLFAILSVATRRGINTDVSSNG